MSEMEQPSWHGLPENRFNTHAWMIGKPEIGEGCWIGAFTVIDGSGGLKIGRGCEISCGVHIYTHSTVHRVISERNHNQVDRKPTSVGDFCHIGANAVILMGSVIGNHCVVGAGAVVLEGTIVPDYSLVVGQPARVLEGATRKWAKPT
jgi:acetyltransferase-like isoleucine patch superfamily enzyme